MKNFVVYLKISFLLLWIFINMPILWLISKTRVLCKWYNEMYFKVVCFILGIRVKIKSGKLADVKNLLLVCNHNSYFDIFALGSVLKINFVAKEDVKNWPIFGIITRLGNTVYISRDRMKAGREVNFMEKELEKRKIPLLVFPEGTSTDGNEVLPFKSSLFAMFENHIGQKLDNQITVQPISIAYTREGKRLINDEERHNYAWYIKEQGLVEHLINALHHTPFTMEIIIHKPIDISTGFNNRKDLALYCHNVVEKGFKKLVGKK